jgi:hypothetical protein
MPAIWTKRKLKVRIGYHNPTVTAIAKRDGRAGGFIDLQRRSLKRWEARAERRTQTNSFPRSRM